MSTKQRRRVLTPAQEVAIVARIERLTIWIPENVAKRLGFDPEQLARVCASHGVTTAEFVAEWVAHGLRHCDEKAKGYDASAAPEMFAALQRIANNANVRMWNSEEASSRHAFQDILNEARAVLAKAGKESLMIALPSAPSPRRKKRGAV